MKNLGKNNILWIGVGALFGIILLAQLFSLKNPNNYQTKIENMRQQKDAQFQKSGNSPILEAKRNSFKGLFYFPIEENYKVWAKLEASKQNDTLVISTTKGEKMRYFRAGTLVFTLFDYPSSLNAYRSAENPASLFVPFKDLTTNVSTYGGGRYLDIPYKEGQEIELDFNLAYNPYCVYNEHYSCPIPPKENKLNREILAGEKNWKE
jgi:uncharacterized protein (DUF1684 family)